jgi:hypothetical protein
MRLVQPDSLADTLDAVNAALLAGQPLTAAQREDAARWIAGRQGLIERMDVPSNSCSRPLSASA